jgi:hypothetical protein
MWRTSLIVDGRKQYTWVTTNGPGHTSLVISTQYDSSGKNGTFLTLGQNDTQNGERQFTVSNGIIQNVAWTSPSVGGLRAINWLHDPSSDISSSPHTVAGDFNGDGKADVVGIHDLGNGQTKAELFAGTTTGLAAPVVVWDSGVNGWDWSKTKWLVGDFTGDGKADFLAFRDYGNFETKAYLFAGTASGGAFPITPAWDSGVNSWDWNQM